MAPPKQGPTQPRGTAEKGRNFRLYPDIERVWPLHAVFRLSQGSERTSSVRLNGAEVPEDFGMADHAAHTRRPPMPISRDPQSGSFGTWIRGIDVVGDQCPATGVACHRRLLAWVSKPKVAIPGVHPW